MLTSFAKQVNSAKTKVFHKPALAIDQTNRAKVTPVGESILQCRKAEINKSTSNVLIAPVFTFFREINLQTAYVYMKLVNKTFLTLKSIYP